MILLIFILYVNSSFERSNCVVKILTVVPNVFSDKRHRTLAELLFKRSPSDKKTTAASIGRKGGNLEIMAGNKGFRYINKKPEIPKQAGQGETTKTRNAVYCAIVMEEFVKELAALSQEHAIVYVQDDGYSSC